MWKLHDSTQERKTLVQEDTDRLIRTIHSKWIRDQAFHSKVQTNKDRIDKIHGPEQALLKSKQEMNELVSIKLENLSSQFGKTESDTQEKSERIFDAERGILYDQLYVDIDINNPTEWNFLKDGTQRQKSSFCFWTFS